MFSLKDSLVEVLNELGLDLTESVFDSNKEEVYTDSTYTKSIILRKDKIQIRLKDDINYIYIPKLPIEDEETHFLYKYIIKTSLTNPKALLKTDRDFSLRLAIIKDLGINVFDKFPKVNKKSVFIHFNREIITLAVTEDIISFSFPDTTDFDSPYVKFLNKLIEPYKEVDFFNMNALS